MPPRKDELLREMDAAGVRRAVIVPPSWEGDRNDRALAASSARRRWQIETHVDAPDLLRLLPPLRDGQVDINDSFRPAAAAGGDRAPPGSQTLLVPSAPLLRPALGPTRSLGGRGGPLHAIREGDGTDPWARA